MDNVNAASATPAAPAASAPEAVQAKPSLFETLDNESDGAPVTKAPEAKAPEAPVAPTKRAYKFKIDDQEVTEELSEEDVVKWLQKAKGADKRFQEASTLKQQSERLYQLLKDQPLDIVEKIHGDKARQMMEERLWAKIQREQMNPQERELAETKERLQALESEKKQAETKRQQEEFAKLKQQHAANFDKEIRDALAASGKPVTAYSYKRVAHYMLGAMNEGRQLAAKDAIPMMDADLQGDLKSMFESVSEDQILALLGDPVLEKVRKADLKRVRGGNMPTPPPVVPEKKEEKKPSVNDLTKKHSLFDWE